MVLPDSHEISRVSQYSGTGTVTLTFEYGTVTLSGGAFLLTSSGYAWIGHSGPTTPYGRIRAVWALPRSLAATWGISIDFSSCRY